MLDMGNVRFADIAPDSISGDPAVSAAMQALDAQFAAVSELAVIPSILARIDQQPGDVLDHLAWQLNSKTWRDSWSLDLKRSVIKSLIVEQSKKGTRYSLEAAVRSYGSNVTIREWWETAPKGTPHTVSLTLSINTLSAELGSAEIQEDLLRRIDDVKPVRTQYDWNLALEAETGIGVQSAARPCTYTRLHTYEAP